MHCKLLLRSKLSLATAALLMGVAATGYATDQSPPTTELPVSPAAEAAYQVAADEVRDDWRLDPAIFTEILPVNAPEIAIKLPEDQREAH